MKATKVLPNSIAVVDAQQIPVFRTQYRRITAKPRVFKNPSRTNPSFDLTISEIIRRSQNGLTVPTIPDVYYDGDTTLPDLTRMDFAELHRFVLEQKAKSDANERIYKEAKNTYEKERFEQEVERRATIEIAKRDAQPQS